MDFPHFRRDEIDGRGDERLASFEVMAEGGFVEALDVQLGFVGDEEEAAGLGDSDHFADGLGAVVEEAGAADVEDNVEGGIGEGQALGIGEEEAGVELPLAEVGLAVQEHF